MVSSTRPMEEFKEFLTFFRGYITSRILHSGKRFESGKDIIVAFLIVKRGKYSQSFLNTSFFLLIAATLIGGPVIAENNPFIGEYQDDGQDVSSGVFGTDIYSTPLQTQYSVKPRAGVEKHIVKSGETLASLSKTYDVSVDSIKWASGLKNDTIRPGDELSIPPVTGVVYTVRTGDTIYSIAKRYGTDAQEILNYPFNDFADIDTFALTPGQTLVVPHGAPPQERPVTPRFRSTIAAGTPGSGQFIWPTSGTITQYPIWYHMALDIANRSLPPIIAADTGTVSFAGWTSNGYGLHVVIDHGNGFSTLYGHMSRVDVSVGQGVGRGQMIGRLGSTGRSTGPHLHFEIRKGGALQNPLSYLK